MVEDYRLKKEKEKRKKAIKKYKIREKKRWVLIGYLL